MYETVREIHSLAYCKHYLLEDTMLKLHPKKLREAVMGKTKFCETLFL